MLLFVKHFLNSTISLNVHQSINFSFSIFKYEELKRTCSHHFPDLFVAQPKCQRPRGLKNIKRIFIFVTYMY